MYNPARTVAIAVIGSLIGGLMTTVVVPAAMAATEEISIEASKVLELQFDGTLADTKEDPLGSSE